jgi:hypothetical protein
MRALHLGIFEEAMPSIADLIRSLVVLVIDL